MRFLAFLVAVAATAQTPAGSITGTLVDSVTHRPVRKIEVDLVFPQIADVAPKEMHATTDAAGAFAFHDLKPGQYRIYVERQTDYPAAKEVTASPSEDPKPVTIEVVPAAVVSGRILDEDGDPLDGCWAQARRAEDPGVIVSAQIARTSAEPSEYRLFGLEPGKYILSVQCVMAAFQPRPLSAGPDPPPSFAYPLQYYPAAPDAASAERIDLVPGTERTGIDFKMHAAHVTQVRAVLAPPLRNPLLRLLPANDLYGDPGADARPESSGNDFLFQRVFPGSYVLVAIGDERRIAGLQPVEVKDEPVNAVIEVKNSLDIHGAVELESGPHSASVQLSKIHIQLLPQYAGIGTFVRAEHVSVKEDGTFSIKSVMPTRWRIYVNGAPVFVKSVWLGARESTGPALDLSSGSGDGLKIVLSANTAAIRGTTAPGAVVMRRDLDDRLPFRSYPPVTADANGQFHIDGLAPGRYRLAAGVSREAIREDSGEEISVQEGDIKTITLTAP